MRNVNQDHRNPEALLPLPCNFVIPDYITKPISTLANENRFKSAESILWAQGHDVARAAGAADEEVESFMSGMFLDYIERRPMRILCAMHALGSLQFRATYRAWVAGSPDRYARTLPKRQNCAPTFAGKHWKFLGGSFIPSRLCITADSGPWRISYGPNFFPFQTTSFTVGLHVSLSVRYAGI